MGNNSNPINFSTRDFISFILLILIICLVLQTVLYRKCFYSISADESGRIVSVTRLIKQPSQIFKPQPWLPFYNIIHVLGLKIYYDLFLMPRIVTGIFGFGAVLALMLFSHVLFQQKEITILSGILGLFFPHRIILSMVPLSEIIYIFFITGGLTFFIRWINNHNRNELVLASLGFAIASAVRYEGWSFVIIMFFILCYYRFYQNQLDWKQYVNATIILGLFPFYWLIAILVTNQLQVIGVASERFLHYFQDSFFEVWKKNFIHQFLKESLLTFNFVSPITLIVLTRSHKKFRFLSIMLFGSLFLMTLIGQIQKSLPSHNWWRLAFPTSFLLLPFLAFLIYKISSVLTLIRWRQLTIIISVTAVFILIYLNKAYQKTQWSHFTKHDREVGEFIKKRNFHPSRKILIDSSVWNYLNVMVASNRTDQFVLLSGKDPLKNDQDRENNLIEHLHEMVNQDDISMILLWDQNNKYRALVSEIKILDHHTFGHWQLLDISN